MHQLSHFFGTYHYVVKIILVFLTGSVLSVCALIGYRRFLPRFIRKDQLWPQAVLRTVHDPLQIYIWLMMVSFVVSIVADQFAFNGDFIAGITIVQRLLTLLFIFWFVMRFIRDFEKGVALRVKAGVSRVSDETNVYAMAQLSRIVLITMMVLMLLQMAGVKMSALLTLGGVGGAVIGFAAKDSLANFIGGMMIYWDRPFSVGDWIRSPDREIEGTVENIGWRLTRIRTFETRVLYVPNGVLSNIAIENPSRMLRRRIKISLGVRYRDSQQIVAITQALENMLKTHPDIDTQQTTFVALTEFGPYSLNILIYAFTKTTDQLKFQTVLQEILLKTLAIVSQYGAACAYPTQSIDMSEAVCTALQKGEHP